MLEDLFIDYVDIEWALRAKHNGFQSFGVANAFMSHSLGDAPIFFLGKPYPARSPLRHYYMFRNGVWLYRQSYLPLNWKIVDAWSLTLKFFFYCLFASPRITHLRMMLRGVVHGLTGRMGRYRCEYSAKA
jgi:rhamnosyltransferase